MDREKVLRELRRNQNTLVIVGAGVIAFGAWSFIKAILTIILRMGDPLAGVDFADEVPPGLVYVVFYGIIAVVFAADLALRLYVGFSARKEGLAGKKGSAYIVLAWIMAAASVFSIVSGAIGYGDAPAETEEDSFELAIDLSQNESIDDKIVSALVELTSTATLVQLAVSGMRVKRLRRLAEELEA